MLNARGFTLLEVLITLIVLSIGMLGLANLQSKVHAAELESYQRAQAVLLLHDMVDKINTNRGDAAAYVTTTPLGTESPAPTLPLAACATTPGAARDRCEWDRTLKGAAETSSGGSSVGAMIGARGCVEQLQASNPATGVCTPGVYRVSVAWQGLTDTSAPALACGQDAYGRETLRRVVSINVTIGLPSCAPAT